MITSRFKVLLAEKEMRDGRTISLREVVRETGVPISTVQGLANNTLREYPRDGISALCAYFECTLADLLVYTPGSAEKNETPAGFAVALAAA